MANRLLEVIDAGAVDLAGVQAALVEDIEGAPIAPAQVLELLAGDAASAEAPATGRVVEVIDGSALDIAGAQDLTLEDIGGGPIGPTQVLEILIPGLPGQAGATGATGATGSPGPTGPAGGTIAPVAFSYGDASGAIFTPASAGTLTVTRLVITTPFNGTGAALAIGTLASPGAALPADANDPAVDGEYELTADLHLDAGEALRLTVTPGSGGNAGAGLIYLTFIPD